MVRRDVTRTVDSHLQFAIRCTDSGHTPRDPIAFSAEVCADLSDFSRTVFTDRLGKPKLYHSSIFRIMVGYHIQRVLLQKIADINQGTKAYKSHNAHGSPRTPRTPRTDRPIENGSCSDSDGSRSSWDSWSSDEDDGDKNDERNGVLSRKESTPTPERITAELYSPLCRPTFERPLTPDRPTTPYRSASRSRSPSPPRGSLSTRKHKKQRRPSGPFRGRGGGRITRRAPMYRDRWTPYQPQIGPSGHASFFQPPPLPPYPHYPMPPPPPPYDPPRLYDPHPPYDDHLRMFRR